MWTKHIICTLLSSYFVISPLKWRKRTDRQTSACAVCTTSPTYPSSFTPQCSGIQHPLKSVVLPRQSAAHHQLLAFAPSITQHILQKKKTSTWYSQEYTNIYHSFLAHYKISYKSLQHIMYTLYPNTRRSHPGHRHSARHRLELPSSRSPPTPPVSRSAITRLWVVFQQEGASSSCEGTSFCYLKEAYRQSLAGIRSQSKVPASGSNLALLWGNSAKHQQGELSYTTAPAPTPSCSPPRLWFGSPSPRWKWKC